MYDVTIKTLPNMTAVTVKHAGPYTQISRAFEQLFGWLGSHGAIDAVARMTALYYDDPSVVPANELRSRAGVVTNRSFPVEAPLEHTEIAGGDYAVLRYKGPYSEMQPAYDWLMGEWLSRSGRKRGDGPSLEEYLNDPARTPPAELLTDIYLPLARQAQ